MTFKTILNTAIFQDGCPLQLYFTDAMKTEAERSAASGDAMKRCCPANITLKKCRPVIIMHETERRVPVLIGVFKPKPIFESVYSNAI